MVLIDYVTRYPEAIPMRSTKAPALAADLLKIFARVGFPSEVVTDQGSNLMSETMQEIGNSSGSNIFIPALTTHNAMGLWRGLTKH